LQAAAVRDVGNDRIIFAPILPPAEHLARLAHADLALDCFPWGSHTTASDMLWGGVPLIGLKGNTFASRVSASLLSAAGLPELIAGSLADYHDLALRLAVDHNALAEAKSRVRAARASSLFDTRRFTRNLEAAYLAIWQRHLAGQAPDHLAVADTQGALFPGVLPGGAN
jgi:predicted O-linked N-acetylglucosamine transferase (SPINDLY family)